MEEGGRKIMPPPPTWSIFYTSHEGIWAGNSWEQHFNWGTPQMWSDTSVYVCLWFYKPDVLIWGTFSSPVQLLKAVFSLLYLHGLKWLIHVTIFPRSCLLLSASFLDFLPPSGWLVVFSSLLKTEYVISFDFRSFTGRDFCINTPFK